MTEAPDVRVYDKTFKRVAWVGDPIEVIATPRHNQQPSGSITVAESSCATPALLAPGARVVIRHQDKIVLGGPCRLISVSGPERDRRFELQIQDDWRLFRRLLGWPVPGQPIASQSGAEYDVRTGPAETVLKQLVQANVTRLGLPVTVAPTQGRGLTIKVRSRMDTLDDLLFPAVDQAGIGTTVRQTSSGLLVDCYKPTTFEHTLSEAGGTVTGISWSRNPPEMTRVVVGGPGDGTERLFRTRISDSLEELWGDVIEGFIDARDVKADDPDRIALMNARGDQALAEAGLKYGLSLDLLESSIFRYGGTDGVNVGDRVPVEIFPGQPPVVDVIREATLTWNKRTPTATWKPIVGERRDDADRVVAAALSRVMTAVRSLQRRR